MISVNAIVRWTLWVIPWLPSLLVSFVEDFSNWRVDGYKPSSSYHFLLLLPPHHHNPLDSNPPQQSIHPKDQLQFYLSCRARSVVFISNQRYVRAILFRTFVDRSQLHLLSAECLGVKDPTTCASIGPFSFHDVTYVVYEDSSRHSTGTVGSCLRVGCRDYMSQRFLVTWHTPKRHPKHTLSTH